MDDSVAICPINSSNKAGSSVKVSSPIWGLAESTTARAASGSLDSSRQYTYPLSRKSGLSLCSVARFSTLCTISCAFSGIFRKSLTVAVRSCSCTTAVVFECMNGGCIAGIEGIGSIVKD